MRGTVLHRTGDIRFEEVAEPKITKPTDAMIRLAATCVCGSDLWSYRGISPVNQPTPMGHEYCGIVEEVGSAVKTVKPGQFVIGSFFASDNTCPHCNFGYQSSCHDREFVGGAQSPLLRVPLSDGTLVSTPGVPAKEMISSLLTTSDVLGTGWFTVPVSTSWDKACNLRLLAMTENFPRGAFLTTSDCSNPTEAIEAASSLMP
jgi:threonine dehydrogenase-like Zn-dependent dehydrogenase